MHFYSFSDSAAYLDTNITKAKMILNEEKDETNSASIANQSRVALTMELEEKKVIIEQKLEYKRLYYFGLYYLVPHS